MTEYDFSPEAYNRHLETQARIARWTHSTHRVPQADPFAPPTSANPAASLPHNSSLPPHSTPHRRRTRSSDRSHSRKTSPPPPLPLHQPPKRATPVRSQTAPPKGDIYGVYGAPQPPQSQPQPYYPTAYVSAPAAGGGYFTLPPPPPQPPQPPQHRRSRSTSHPPRPAEPARSRSYSVAPPPPPGQGQQPKGYVFATQPQYAYAQNAYAQNASQPPPPPQYAYAQPPQAVRSPTREVPLLKRVFGFGGGGKSSAGVSREGSRSRESSREGRRPRRGDSY
ncbi:hypothetical protein C8R43DRAFT_166532 [Mycena crocata]|nr:hypothetical protein C8R43DRAFT_166532 [Mycena crocata]